MLLEELLEQEKREQERDGGVAEWSVAPAAAPPAVPLYGGVPPPAPPPPDRADPDPRPRHLYEAWLKQNSAFTTDQLRYYEAEVQKLRKIRKVSP